MSEWVTGSVEWMGFLAGLLTSIAWVPQLIQLVKTHDARGISLIMTFMMFAGITLWGIYGALIGSDALVVVNLATAVLIVGVIFLKLRMDRERARGGAPKKGVVKKSIGMKR